MNVHPARQAYVEEANGPEEAMEGIDYASVRTSSRTPTPAPCTLHHS
jgi:hypothetical protein